MTRALFVSVLAAAAMAAPACGSGGSGRFPVVDASVNPGTDVDFISCAAETRATPYQAGMQVTSSAGRLVLKLLRNTFTDADGHVLEEAPAKGVDVWTVETDDATTLTPVAGLAISVRPWMPDHGHGTTSVGVMPAGGGVYTVSPVNLYMAGYWETTFTLVDSSTGSAVSDTALLKLCVPD